MLNRNRQSLPLKGGIHTVSIRSDDIPKDIPSRVAYCIKSRDEKKNIKTKAMYYATIVNPNNYAGQVVSLADFNNVMSRIANDLEIKHFSFTRVDFAIDNLEPGSFEKNYKLNRLLISLLDLKYATDPGYKSADIWTEEDNAVRMKGEYLETEYYSKEKESHGESPVISRLELRIKRFTKTKRSIEEELHLMCDRLRTLLDLTDKVTDKYNTFLLRDWEKEKTSGTVRSKNEFFRKHQGRIFTDRQLVALCESMGSTKKYGMEIKRKAGIQTISPLELEEYVDLIATIIRDFAVDDSIRDIDTMYEIIAMQMASEEKL